MTMLMTIIGVVVFAFSIWTVGFTSSFKRLLAFALTGLCIDIIIVAIASTVMFVSL